MSDEEVKTCVSCSSFEGPTTLYMQQMQLPSRDSPTCKHPKAATRDPIYGRAFCQNERQSKKGCGPKGKLWEKKT